MTTRRYPDARDPVDALTRADGTTETHENDHGRIIDAPENVKHYGAKGDGSSDDTAAIQAALDAVLTPSSPLFGRPLLFPSAKLGAVFGGYKFGALDWHDAGRVGGYDFWQHIYIAAPLFPQVTMNIPARRITLEGVSSAYHTNFDMGAGAWIDGNALGSDPVLKLSGTSNSMQMKNLSITRCDTGVTVDQGVCNMYFDNVSVSLNAGSTGSCMVFDGGFGYYFKKCSFNAGSGGSAGHAVKFYNADGTDNCRLINIEQSFLGSRGIYVGTGAPNSGIGGQIILDRILMEGGKEAMLTLDSTYGYVAAVTVRNCETADRLITPQPLIKNTGINTYNVFVDQSDSYDDVLEVGSDAIKGLRVLEGSTQGAAINQTQFYEYVGRFGERYQAAPFVRPPITDTTTAGSLDTGVGNTFVLSPSGARFLTAFTNQRGGQHITLIFTNGNTTIFNGANVKLAGGVNFVGTANDVLRLISDGTTVYEISRSVN